MLGLGITWLAALVHLGGVRFGGAFHNVWTVFKLILIVAFIIAGFAFGNPQPISFAPSTADLAAGNDPALNAAPRLEIGTGPTTPRPRRFAPTSCG